MLDAAEFLWNTYLVTGRQRPANPIRRVNYGPLEPSPSMSSCEVDTDRELLLVARKKNVSIQGHPQIQPHRRWGLKTLRTDQMPRKGE